MRKKYYFKSVMKKIIDVQMTKKQHFTLGIKAVFYLSTTLLLNQYLATSYESFNDALVTLFAILTFLSGIKWITAETNSC